MARLARSGGGFTAHADPSHMIGQIQTLDVAVNLPAARLAILEQKENLLEEVAQIDPL